MKNLMLVALIGIGLSGCSFKSKTDNKYAGLKYSVDLYTGVHHLQYRCEEVSPGMAFNCTNIKTDEVSGLVLFSSSVAVLGKLGDEK